MALNGKKLRGKIRSIRKRIARSRSQSQEIAAIRRKALFEARKKEAVIFARQKAKSERESRVRRGEASKIGFRQALGFGRPRATVRRTKQPTVKRIAKKGKKRIKRSFKKATPEFEDSGFTGGGFGFGEI